jgi:hypothetical protein
MWKKKKKKKKRIIARTQLNEMNELNVLCWGSSKSNSKQHGSFGGYGSLRVSVLLCLSL